MADPRGIQLGRFADLAVNHRLGSDVALLNGMMHCILRNGWEAKDYIDSRTEGFTELEAAVADYPPERVQAITGVAVRDIEAMADLYANHGPSALLYAMGITQHTTGVDNVKSCCNLALLCGYVGAAGGGVNPLRGQNNVQGACDMGGLPNVFTGYQPVTVPENRGKVLPGLGPAFVGQARPDDHRHGGRHAGRTHSGPLRDRGKSQTQRSGLEPFAPCPEEARPV